MSSQGPTNDMQSPACSKPSSDSLPPRNRIAPGFSSLKRSPGSSRRLQGIYDLFYKQYEMDTRDYARSVAISPDGRLVATGFLYEGIKVWEVDTGMPVHSLEGHTSSVNSIAFSPDSQWLASGSRDRVDQILGCVRGAGNSHARRRTTAKCAR